MARRSYRNFIAIVLAVLAVALIAYSCMGGKSESKSSETVATHTEDQYPDSMPIQHVEDYTLIADDGIELIDQPELDDGSFEVGFGMGPGLYGSGRHTSEMIGN